VLLMFNGVAQLMTDVTILLPALNNTIACTKCVVVNAARSILHSYIPMRGIFQIFFLLSLLYVYYINSITAS
jgi:hypothetical protein